MPEDQKIWFLYYRCRHCGKLTKTGSIPDSLFDRVLVEIIGITPVTNGIYEKAHHVCKGDTWGIADFECFSTAPNLATD